MSTPFASTFIESLNIYIYNIFDKEGSGDADVYILCLEEFTSVEMLPPGGSRMFRIIPPGISQKLLFALTTRQPAGGKNSDASQLSLAVALRRKICHSTDLAA
jgi:hypothetical protein